MTGSKSGGALDLAGFRQNPSVVRRISKADVLDEHQAFLALCGNPGKDKSRTAWVAQKILYAAWERGAHTVYLDVALLKIDPCPA